MALERFLHESESGLLIPAVRDIAFEHLALVIDRSPEIVHLAVDFHVDLVEVPAPMTEASHAVYPLPADIAGKEWPKPVPPLAHRLMANVDAALEQQVLDVPQGEWETHVHHYH
jgi:hypothetical protein